MRVFILDDLPLSRGRLIASLCRFQDIEIVGETGDPMEAIRQIKEQSPDAVILDRRVSRRFGIDILRNIKKASPGSEVVILTSRMYQARPGKHIEEEADFCIDKLTGIDEVARILTGAPRKGSGHILTEARS